MSRRIKKTTICFLLVAILIVSAPLFVFADTGTESDKSEPNMIDFTYISMFVNSFTISQYGYCAIGSYLDAYGVDQVRITAYLQRYKDGYWQTLKNWTSLRDGTWHTLSVGWYVVSGYLFRCVTYGHVYINGDIVEYTSHISNYIYY